MLKKRYLCSKDGEEKSRQREKAWGSLPVRWNTMSKSPERGENITYSRVESTFIENRDSSRK